MKSKLFIGVVMCMLFCGVVHGQKSAGKKDNDCGCSFSSINQIGLLEGSSGSAFQAQTVNGLRFNTWFAGVGVGLDRYRTRSIPLFFDLRKELSRKANAPFLYGDIGVNFPWTEQKDKLLWGRNEFKHGMYFDAGAGYKLNLGKGRGLLFSGGFSLKEIRETRYTPTMCINPPCPELEGERFHFSLRRFSLKAGLQL